MHAINDILTLIDQLPDLNKEQHFTLPKDICLAKFIGTLIVELRKDLNPHLGKDVSANNVANFFDAMLSKKKLTAQQINKIAAIREIYNNLGYESYNLIFLEIAENREPKQIDPKIFEQIDTVWHEQIDQYYRYLTEQKFEIMSQFSFINTKYAINEHENLRSLLSEHQATQKVIEIANFIKALHRIVQELSPCTLLVPLVPVLLRLNSYQDILSERLKPSRWRLLLSHIPLINVFLSPLSKSQIILQKAIKLENHRMKSPEESYNDTPLIFGDYMKKRLPTIKHKSHVKTQNKHKEKHSNHLPPKLSG